MEIKKIDSFYKRKGSKRVLEIHQLAEGLIGLRIRVGKDTMSICLDEEKFEKKLKNQKHDKNGKRI